MRRRHLIGQDLLSYVFKNFLKICFKKILAQFVHLLVNKL